MNDLRAAAQQALEALEWHYHQGHSNTLGGLRLKIDEKALRELSATLAQQAEPVQEPVAYTTGHCENHKQKGGCQLHNLQCGWPDCDRKPTTAPPQQAEPVQEQDVEDAMQTPRAMAQAYEAGWHAALAQLQRVGWMQQSTGVIRCDWGFDTTGYVPVYAAQEQSE